MERTKYELWKEFMDIILNTNAQIQIRMPKDLKLFITSAKHIKDAV